MFSHYRDPHLFSLSTQDASSALLVMKSLKQLVNIQGVTVVAAIHQPRKYIFDLFDSLILLGVGGRMVYHGAANSSLAYFRSLHYSLPTGESLADWLIDVSSGRLEADNLVATSKAAETKTSTKSKGNMGRASLGRIRPKLTLRQASEGLVFRSLASSQANNTVESAPMGTPLADTEVVVSRGVATGKVARAFEEAQARRIWLYDEWSNYFKNLKGTERMLYEVPDKCELPSKVVKPTFYEQFDYQIRRALLVTWRNRVSKSLESLVIIGAAMMISLMDGVQKVTVDANPEIPFIVATRPRPDDGKFIFTQLFQYAYRANQLA